MTTLDLDLNVLNTAKHKSLAEVFERLHNTHTQTDRQTDVTEHTTTPHSMIITN